MNARRFAVTVLPLCVLILCRATRPVHAQDAESLSESIVREAAPIEPMKQEVDRLLRKGDNVNIRSRVDSIYRLIDRLVEEGREQEALHYLAEALRVDAWALDYQLLRARLLQKDGQTDEARSIAEMALQYAETDQLVNEARALLGQEPLPDPEKIRLMGKDEPAVVLVPIGEPALCVLEDLKTRLAKHLGVRVLVADADVDLPAPKRDALEPLARDLRPRLKRALEEDIRAKKYLNKQGITADNLEDPRRVIQAYRHLIYAFADRKTLAQFDEVLVPYKRSGQQWDTNELKSNLRAAIGPYVGSRAYFLGVTDKDMFRGRTNFLFGSASTTRHYAIISTHRFTDWYNGDTPNRRRLTDRALKMAFCCVGSMVGLPACPTPTCPRTYPHTLKEVDATTLELCPNCRKGFERVLGPLPKQTGL